MIPPRDLLLAPRRLPPECRDHEDAGLSVASRVRTLQLPQRGCRVQGPSPKVASRLSSALGMPAASTLLDLVPGGSRLYWRGWGGAADCEQTHVTDGKGPRVSRRHHELCGAQSQAWRRGDQVGTRGTLLISGRLALWGAAAWVMQTEPWSREADDLEQPGSASGNPWTDYKAL